MCLILLQALSLMCVDVVFGAVFNAIVSVVDVQRHHQGVRVLLRTHFNDFADGLASPRELVRRQIALKIFLALVADSPGGDAV